MRIAILSDQHGNLPPIPPCDLMILSGDICGGPDHIDGKWRPDLSDKKWYMWLQNEFTQWIGAAPHTIVIAGNHDTCVQKWGFPPIDRVTYLHDSVCEIGGLKFWGTPWIKWFDGLAFNASEDELFDKWSHIPEDTDILVCHMPPYGLGIFDAIDLVDGKNVGSIAMKETIARIKPKLVTCGHIHEGHGEYQIGWTKIVNAASKFIVVDL